MQDLRSSSASLLDRGRVRAPGKGNRALVAGVVSAERRDLLELGFRGRPGLFLEPPCFQDRAYQSEKVLAEGWSKGGDMFIQLVRW